VCGICGKVEFRDGAVDRSLIHRMCETIVHNDPDGEEIYAAPHIGLWQRRLWIPEDFG
jgi:asparagine synthetase B (glutamine-hydrolysing)